MAMTVGELKERKRDYFLARSQDDELVMEPFCYCGKTLEQEYFCTDCNHKCHVTLIVCDDPGALALAQKLLAGSPDFHKFEVETLAR
jgi:hypothetical protein